MARVCVVLADGFEEIEAVTVIDVLRRADVEVITAGVGGRSIRGSHAITVATDSTLEEAAQSTYDLVVLPGGMPGSRNLRDHPTVKQLVRDHVQGGRKVAAICAAPMALASFGILSGREATCYPGFEKELGDAAYVERPVVVSGPVTTSRGVGTALAFALSLVEQLVGADAAAEQARRMLVEQPSLIQA